MPDSLQIAITLSSVLTFISIVAVYYSSLRFERRKRMARALRSYREDLRARSREDLRGRHRKRHWRPARAVSALGRLVDRIKLVGNDQSEKIRMTLIQAGFRAHEAVILYLALKLLLPISGAVLALTVILTSEITDGSWLYSFIAVAGAALIFSYIPDFVLRRITESRRKKLGKGIPDALDLLVVCAEAGLGLDGALKKVADDFARSNPVTAEELSLLNAELTFFQDREEALHNFSKRVNLPLATSVVLALTQAERYGTPLSHALRTLSAEFRRERLLAAEQKAGRLPVIMTVPLIAFILPALFVVILGPAILSALELMP